MHNEEKFVPVQLESVNLDDMHHLMSQVQHTRRELQEMEIPHLHTATSIWTVILYLVLVSAIICAVWYKYKEHFRIRCYYKRKVNNVKEITLEDVSLEKLAKL